MMRKIQKFSLHVFVFAMLAAVASSVCAAPVQVKTTSQDYLSCASASKKDPERALEIASAWLKQQPEDLSALHCKSIALVALKRYAQASKSLEAMWLLLKDSDAYTLQLNVLRQAARAANLANAPEEAMKYYDMALRIMGRDDGGDGSYSKTVAVEILLDRIAYYRLHKEWLNALQDADYAITYGSQLEKVLLERARIYIALGQRQLAKDDLTALLAQDPSNKEASVLLKSVTK